MCDFNTRLVNTMSIELNKGIRSGIYGFTQREMAYNSNKIEGSRLNKEHTASLFDTHSVYGLDEYRAKDIEETTGHFVMFNYMLNTIDNQLSEEIIKNFHRCLKQGVFEDIANGYAIGDYKKRVNFVGDIKTSHPSEVATHMKELLDAYRNMQKDLKTLAWLHSSYESIHPFQDGNGRTGRIILFREALVNGIIPFIIRDVNKAKYTNLLNDAHKYNKYNELANYFEEEQNWYFNKVKDALI